MITSIDFGCYSIRSAHRHHDSPRHIELIDERSEYVVLPADNDCRQTLVNRQIHSAECENSIVVFGNQAAEARWLSRQPCASLFSDGRVPGDDPPARQILNILTQAILPQSDSKPGVCCFTAPGGKAATENIEFLSRLIRMHGYVPLHCTASVAAMLAAGNESSFTGITIICGAETTEVGICRYGLEIASEAIDVGSNWIDTELARQFQVQTWDDQGDCYLDLESVRKWKHTPGIHLRNTVSEREKTLARLYSVMLNRVADSVRRLLASPVVQHAIRSERLAVICAGGPTVIGGFSGALTERLVEHDIASRLLSVRVVEDAATAIVRGLLIQGELEVRRSRTADQAA